MVNVPPFHACTPPPSVAVLFEISPPVILKVPSLKYTPPSVAVLPKIAAVPDMVNVPPST